jgi:PAT family beta-lactamase induction signal transducer AmpG
VYLVIIFIGFANALPLPILGSNLSIWLTESGYEKSTIGLFALVGLPFSFNILWSPLMDQITLPFLSHSPRKGWLVFALSGMIASLLFLSCIDPAANPWGLASSLFLLSTFAGCLYIIGLKVELESVDEARYSIGSACVITGYRTGLLCAGGGALYLAFFYSWSWMFFVLAMLLCLGCIGILLQPEPYKSKASLAAKREQFSQYSSFLKGFWQEIIHQPCREFFQRNNWLTLLLLVVVFKAGDQLAKVMEGPFYLYLGFDKAELAFASKMCGFAATVLGAFVTGLFLKDKDPFLSLGLIGTLHAMSLSGYSLLAIFGKSHFLLYLTTAVSNFTGGMAMAAFIFFLWRICSKKYAAVQYALLWSLFSFKADIIACIGGIIAATCSWDLFFLTVTSIGIASSLLIWYLLLRSSHSKSEPLPHLL